MRVPVKTCHNCNYAKSQPGGCPHQRMPADLMRVLRDQSIVVPQDAAVFEMLARWRDAPSNTASA
jgi:hypothetical protein